AGTVIAFTLLILFTLTPRYTSSTQILLDLRSQQVTGIEELLPSFTMDMTAVESQVSIIESSSLLRRVVEKENLVDDPEFGASKSGGNWLSSLMGFVTSLLKKAPAADTPADINTDAIPPDVLASIGRLSAALDVKRIDRTKVLQIDVTSENPQKAARLANAIADAFIVDQLEARFDNARRAANWLGDRLQELREDLRNSEEAVEDFRSKNNLVMTNTGTVNEQQLSEINGKLVAARAEAAESKAKLDQATRIIEAKGNIQAIPDVLKSSVISNLRTQQAEVVRREADLVSRYGDRHPGVVNVRAERREIDRQISNEVDRIVGNLKNAYDVTQS
ncbi:MAG: GumC family protein, partial [Thermomicrobiales bacterium]